MKKVIIYFIVMIFTVGCTHTNTFLKQLSPEGYVAKKERKFVSGSGYSDDCVISFKNSLMGYTFDCNNQKEFKIYNNIKVGDYVRTERIDNIQHIYIRKTNGKIKSYKLPFE